MWLREYRKRQKEIQQKNRLRRQRMEGRAAAGEKAGKEKKTGRKRRLLAVLIIAAAVAAVFFPARHFLSSDSRKTVIAGGSVYEQKEDVTTILLLGIDKRETLENETGLPADNGQSDMIWLIVADHRKKQIRILTIPRETMANVEEHHSDGSTQNVYEQICLQYAYGTTPQEGCSLTAEAVKNLLEDAPVDHVCAVSMGAVTRLVDAVGGVDIVMSNNYSIPDENWEHFIEYEAGSTVHMDGETAYRFIHYRDVEHLYTNLDRMNRQQDFLTAFTAALKETIKSRPWKILGLLKELKPYYYTDLSFVEMLRLAATALSANISEIERIQIPGTETHVGRYDQYLPDQEKLREMMLEIFYEKKR